ncbi:hypothetical protein [Spirosoma sp.]|uniref:hypothetical protein n=1 Tax=Spirosoma sp. TaxID=1899569 RepID=UPI0026325233|nr:hypothetical protein [Spirosoma sp.]MCX6218242.1 hypothetical protein [Spirosoma sp.]
MNPLNPWVAFAEILLLLVAAFLLGYVVAYGQYNKQIRTRKSLIRQLKTKLNLPDQTQSKSDQVEEIIPETE